MDYAEFPKWVRGEIAQDAEDESRIEREWTAANPGPESAPPPPPDTSIAPTDVSQSSVPSSDEPVQ